MCECPAGTTGNNCAKPCGLPPGCLEAENLDCAFDTQVDYAGIKCTACADGYFMDQSLATCTGVWRIDG